MEVQVDKPICNEQREWGGLYSNTHRFNKYLSPETTVHPAKMSMKLVEKILLHIESLHLIHKGDMIVDFMCGTARTGVVAELHGYAFTGIELESHFIELIEKNREVLKSVLQRDPAWTIIHGDARHLSDLIQSNGVGIVSPPYAMGQGLGHECKQGKLHEEKRLFTRYGNNEAQIGNLNYVGITSLPYSDQQKYIEGHQEAILQRVKDGKLTDNRQKDKMFYSQNMDNIGNAAPQTYTSAMLKVYQEAYKAGISPLVIVTKNPTKNYALRRLDLDTAQLLRTAGYTIIDYHQAVLFNEQKQKTLVGEEHVEYKGQISFFKRLSIQKGNVAADHEDIIIGAI